MEQDPCAGSDASVVKRTQKTLGNLGEDTVHFAASVCIKSAWTLLLLGIFSFIFYMLAAWSLGRQLLLSFPELFSWGIFTRQGPSHEQMKSTSFSMLLIGKGFVSGPPCKLSGSPLCRPVYCLANCFSRLLGDMGYCRFCKGHLCTADLTLAISINHTNAFYGFIRALEKSALDHRSRCCGGEDSR